VVIVKGFRLYVNLGAAQTRRRLKGHGFGVRRVETAGAGRALIVHTATREHLRELEALFADVLDQLPAYEEEPEAVENRRVEDLRNIDATSAAWLRDVGIPTEAELRRFGPVFAYSLVKQRQPACTRNLLWALAGALTDTDWRKLPADEMERLRREADEE
jgi:DNA transformation protein